MAKANQRFRNSQGLSTGLKTHAKEGEYKIPIGLRTHNKDKWTKDPERIRRLKEKKERK